ncbi:putative Ig domain-containing protein [uncultured Agrobacterium sp.]|uniref:putative Ig domain-containing protein n=1 Tax=uncultured Agrobacterium sp. TaxID=157277 RepID=UPI00258CC01A|nr:putative Ig domain-containing protein [uncultured Agrobacterium sp.]
MKKTVAVIAALAALSTADASAGTFVLRSSTTGVIAPIAPSPQEPTIPLPPETPAGFMLSMTGQTSVAAGAALDLRPVVSGASGLVSYSYSGRLPIGANFDVATGRVAGRALIAGSYDVWVSAIDSSGAAVTAEIVIVVT